MKRTQRDQVIGRRHLELRINIWSNGFTNKRSLETTCRISYATASEEAFNTTTPRKENIA
jgi:hypothetical protein